MNFEQIKALDSQYVLQTYGRNPVAIDHGKGATLWDTEGKEYIDFTSGIGVCSLGYANEKWAKAIYDQAMKVGHISNLFYTPKRGDIVVISRNTDNRIDRDSEEPIIKRVIATEGQLVDIDFTTGKVYVDGQLLDEPYIKDYAIEQYSTVDSYGVQFPLRVEENCVFVMGDNRRESLDSRSPQIGNNGQINTKYILGRAILRVYPFNKIGALS